MFWFFLNLRQWNCGFIGPWGSFSIKCDVTTLAIQPQEELLKIRPLKNIFSTNVLCMSHSGLLFLCQVKKICQNKTDGWTPFLLLLKNISTFCVLGTCVSITVFDPIRWYGEYSCFMEVVREMKWAIFTYMHLKH
jgi:hypothetical protein